MTDNRVLLSGAAVRGLLAYGGPSLLVDRIVSYDPIKGSLTAEKLVSQSEPFVQGHFPGFPIVPGVVIIEALAQACRLFMVLTRASIEPGNDAQLEAVLRAGPRPWGFLFESNVKHTNSVVPGQRMLMVVNSLGSEGQLQFFRVLAQVDGVEVGRGRLTLAASPADENPRDIEGPS
jgi:3-hydroxyacyl-[acyl-carrier-protein] dehydratase